MKQGIRTAFKVFTNQKRNIGHSQQSDPIQKNVVKTPGPATSLFTVKRLNEAITKAKDRFLAIQNAKGYWVFDLEADTTISSVIYIPPEIFRVVKCPPTSKRGWATTFATGRLRTEAGPLYHAGAANISASVKAYFALKQLGDSPDAPHMVKGAGVHIGPWGGG